MNKIRKTRWFMASAIILFLATFMFILTSLPSVSSQETLFCAEKTVDGAWCQNVPEEECAEGFECDRTSCESTSYCSTGTCVNTVTGSCLPGTQATCNPSEGGFFYSEPREEVAQCQIGCCLMGDQVALTERTKCDVLGSDYGVDSTFRSDITDEASCIAMASPEEEGACVFETETGRDCDFTTRGNCQDSSGEFHQGFLCSAPELGTNCAMTQRTTCEPGGNKVHFIDSCGNLANIYDANKINDVPYWSYVPGVEGVEVDVGDNDGNKNSRTNGFCSYLDGSTCSSGNAEYGNFICRDLSCQSNELTGGVTRDHGESWCSEPKSNFEDSRPGDTSYLLYCYDGEVSIETCDYYRNELCQENEESGDAACVVNRWQECFFQETTDDCLDEDSRDCKILEGNAAVAFSRTAYGTEGGIIDSDTNERIEGACVPKYSPGFKFWDPTDTLSDINLPDSGDDIMSMCEISNVICVVPYTQQVAPVSRFNKDYEDSCVETCIEEEGWSASECRSVCTPSCLENPSDQSRRKDFEVDVNEEWAEGYQELCTAIGDCGVMTNYRNLEGYNSWLDLFSGNRINWDTLPNS